MLFLGVIMFYGQVVYKKKGAEWGKFLTLICCFAIIGLAIYINIFLPKVSDNKIAERERAYQRAQSIVLGATLSKNYFGNGKCLAVYNGYSIAEYDLVQKMAADLKEGFGGKVTDFKFVSIQPVIINSNEVLDDYALYEIEQKAESYNKIFAENPGYDLVVFFSGITVNPEQLLEFDIFKMIEDPENPGQYIKDPKKKYPVVGVYNGSMENLELFVADSLIHAVCVWKYAPNTEKFEAPESVRQAFDDRYIMVTPENYMELRKTNKEIFPSLLKK